MLFHSDSTQIPNSLKSNSKLFNGLDQYGSNLFISPLKIAPISLALLQSHMSKGAKLIYLLTDFELFSEDSILLRLNQMTQVKCLNNQKILLIHSDISPNLVRLMKQWNENGGVSYPIPLSMDLNIELNQWQQELNPVAIDGHLTLSSLPHITNSMAIALEADWGVAGTLSMITIATESTASRLTGITGLTWEQIQDIRNWVQLKDGYELQYSRLSSSDLQIREGYDNAV